MKTELQIYELNDTKKYHEAIDTARKFLKSYPLSIHALKELAYSFENLAQLDSSQHYLDLVARIMSGMIYGGDGRTPETAMFALGPSDGKFLLTTVGAGVGDTKFDYDKNNNFLVIIEVILKDKKPYPLHFNIQHANNRRY